MQWQLDPHRKAYIRQLTTTIIEVTGRFTTPSDSTRTSLPTLQPLIDLFSKQGTKDWEYAPDSLRLTEGKLRTIPSDVMEWAVKEGALIAIERNGKPIAYRMSEGWQDWLLDFVSFKEPPKSIDWTQIERGYARYGRLGLRIAAQIAFGDSHYLDGAEIPTPYKDMIWIIPDAIPNGANIVRLGGKISLSTPYSIFSERWAVPGHFLWSWDIAEILPRSVCTGDQILLVENPYVFWHLLNEMKEQEFGLVCLHGETRHSPLLGEDADLFRLLQLILSQKNKPSVSIWCDPDPGGLIMASNAKEIITRIGGDAAFLMMGEDALTRIEEISLSGHPLLLLTEKDRAMLRTAPIHNDLLPLAREIEKRSCKGEQECLALHYCSKGGSSTATVVQH